MAKVLTAAVIGAGAIARQHLAGLNACDHARVVGLCDLSPTLAEMTAQQHGVPNFFVDHREMLKQTKPDVVHVVTPPPTHFKLGMEVLEQGSHLIIEKPITSTAEQLEALASAAAQRQRIVIEDHNYLFNGSIRKLRDLIASGELGEIAHVEIGIALDILGEESRFADANVAHPCLSEPGGAISDFLPHLAYLAVALVGQHESVRSVWSKRTPDSPLPSDEMRAQVRGQHGTATLLFSAHAQPDMFWVRVLGTRMRAEAHLFEPRLVVEKLYDNAKPLMPLRNGFAIAKAEAASGLRGLWRKLSGGPGSYEGLRTVIDQSYAAISKGLDPPISLEQVRHTKALIADLTDQEYQH